MRDHDLDVGVADEGGCFAPREFFKFALVQEPGRIPQPTIPRQPSTAARLPLLLTMVQPGFQIRQPAGITRSWHSDRQGGCDHRRDTACTAGQPLAIRGLIMSALEEPEQPLAYCSRHFVANVHAAQGAPEPLARAGSGIELVEQRCALGL